MSVDMRVTIASAVAVHLQEAMSAVMVTTRETTSGCPLIELTMSNGDVYNLTITKARKKR